MSGTTAPSPADENLRQATGLLLRMTGQTVNDLAAAIPWNSPNTWRRRLDGSPFTLPEATALAEHFGVPLAAMLDGPLIAARQLPPQAVRVDRRTRRRAAPKPQPVKVPTRSAARRATRRYLLRGHRPDGVTRLLQPALRRVA